MTADEFMEKHGHQVLTSLRTSVEFWEDIASSTPGQMSELAAQEAESWRKIYAAAESVVA